MDLQEQQHELRRGGYQRSHIWNKLLLTDIIVKKLTSLKHLVRTTVAELHN